MRRSTMRRRCAQVVAQLSIPDPFDLRELLDRLARRRGRPIQLLLVDMDPGSPCGAWVSLKGTDYVFVERRTSPLHQHHIGLHEVAHMVLEHSGGAVMSDGFLRRLMPDLDPAVVRHALGRTTTYTESEEWEAEQVAFMILTQVKRFAPLPDGGGAEEIGRMASLLHPAPPPH